MSTDRASETTASQRVVGTASKVLIPAAVGLALLSTAVEKVRAATKVSEDTARRAIVGTGSTSAPVSQALLSTSVETVRAATIVPRDTARPPNIEAGATNVVLARDRADLMVIAGIRQLASYHDGWKGPNSIAASRQAREDAEAFARVLFNSGNIIAPHVGMAADGEISFYWKSDHVVVNLGFVGDGTYSYFAQTMQGESFSDDAAPANKALPMALLMLLAEKV